MSSPPSPVTHKTPGSKAYGQGLALLEGGNPKAAAEAFTQALALEPSHAQAHYQLGNCLRMLGDGAGAETSLRAAIQGDPGLQDAYISLAYLYRGAGRPEAAAAALLDLAGRRQTDWQLLLQIADLLADMDRPVEAVTLYKSCLLHDPRLAPAQVKLGLAYQKLGQFQEAEQALLAAIESDPNSDAAYLRLAHTRRWRTEDAPVAEGLEAALARPGLSRDARVCLHFALGKMYDDFGLYDRAFGHFSRGNAQWHEQVHFDRRALADYVSGMKRICVPELFQRAGKAAGPDPVPVFVVGMQIGRAHV